MIQAVPSQKSFDADLAAANADQIVVLHRWDDGMILVMMFDDEMPGFTSEETRPRCHTESSSGQSPRSSSNLPVTTRSQTNSSSSPSKVMHWYTRVRNPKPIPLARPSPSWWRPPR